jgi:hypothetical protein
MPFQSYPKELGYPSSTILSSLNSDRANSSNAGGSYIRQSLRCSMGSRLPDQRQAVCSLTSQTQTVALCMWRYGSTTQAQPWENANQLNCSLAPYQQPSFRRLLLRQSCHWKETLTIHVTLPARCWSHALYHFL